MDILKAETALQASYALGAARYRKDDDVEVTTPHHRRLGEALTRLSGSFGRPISALDAGCGTGRYFYCLRNVERLVGMDISPEMLAAARDPVKSELITARSIELIRGNVFMASFAPRSFDLIYSFGMFGHGCPVTVEICNQFYSWLKPGGYLFFDTIDVGGLPWAERLRKGLRKRLYAIAPDGMRAALDRRQQGTPFFGLTRRELERILGASRFTSYRVTSEVCESPLWQGRHLECLAGVLLPDFPARAHAVAVQQPMPSS